MTDRQSMLRTANAAYARLRAEDEAWAQEQAERAEWDVVLLDGIDDDEQWEDEPE